MTIHGERGTLDHHPLLSRWALCKSITINNIPKSCQKLKKSVLKILLTTFPAPYLMHAADNNFCIRFIWLFLAFKAMLYMAATAGFFCVDLMCIGAHRQTRISKTRGHLWSISLYTFSTKSSGEMSTIFSLKTLFSLVIDVLIDVNNNMQQFLQF